MDNTLELRSDENKDNQDKSKLDSGWQNDAQSKPNRQKKSKPLKPQKVSEKQMEYLRSTHYTRK
jgi:hypothetical protein